MGLALTEPTGPDGLPLTATAATTAAPSSGNNAGNNAGSSPEAVQVLQMSHRFWEPNDILLGCEAAAPFPFEYYYYDY
jgi:hypothetical protein